MIQVPESVLKRNDQRHDELQKKKEEGPSQAEVFRNAFKDKYQEIESLLSSIESVKDKNELGEIFNKISRELVALNRYVSTSSIFLIPYDVKKCMNSIQELQDKSANLESKLLPKKLFGFSSRKNLIKTITKKKDIIDNRMPVINLIDCGLSNKKDEKLILNHNEVDNKDIDLSNLENCDVFINGSPNTIHLVSIKNCRIVTGPVKTSVLVEKCQNSVLSFPCQQLRIHETISTDFYIHVTTKAIIEDSKQVRFAPYCYNYEGVEDHYNESGLDKTINNWDKVDDFNWLVNNKQSPNWSIIPENERVPF